MNHTFGCIDSGSVRTRLILPYGQYVAQYARSCSNESSNSILHFNFSSKYTPCYPAFLHLSTGEYQLNSLGV